MQEILSRRQVRIPREVKQEEVVLDTVNASYRKMGRVETIRIGSLIMALCKKREDGTAEYEPGWNDVRIHAESGTRVSLATISALRLELIGRTKQKKAKVEPLPLSMLNMQLQLSALRQQLDELALWAASRPVQPFKL